MKDVVSNNKIEVQALEEWMDGWEKLYKKNFGSDLTKLDSLEINYAVQQLLWFDQAKVNEKSEKKKIFEFACGDGRVACYLAQHAYQVEAIDVLPISVELARKRAEKLEISENVIISLGNIDNWDLGDEKYHVIVALQCLQYLFERAVPRVKELLMAVKPAGFFVYSGNILPHEETTPTIRFITENEIRAELEGWIIHSIGTNTVRLSPERIRGYLFVVAQKPTKLDRE